MKSIASNPNGDRIWSFPAETRKEGTSGSDLSRGDYTDHHSTDAAISYPKTIRVEQPLPMI
jgi:hypothetical protein